MFGSVTKYLFIASSSLCALGYLQDQHILELNTKKIKNPEVRKYTELVCVEWSLWLESNRKSIWNRFIDSSNYKK